MTMIYRLPGVEIAGLAEYEARMRPQPQFEEHSRARAVLSALRTVLALAFVAVLFWLGVRAFAYVDDFIEASPAGYVSTQEQPHTPLPAIADTSQSSGVRSAAG